mgnify:CR=1 FL=1
MITEKKHEERLNKLKEVISKENVRHSEIGETILDLIISDKDQLK